MRWIKATASKFGNIPTIIDGIRFASKREAKRYWELKMLERAGEIKDLRLQVRFPLVVNSIKIATYVADFCYVAKDGKKIVEDSKGARTRTYITKKKLMQALYGIVIMET